MEKMEFDYYIDEKILRDCPKKSLKLHLKGLYYGNRSRKQYPEEIIQQQERSKEQKWKVKK